MRGIGERLRTVVPILAFSVLLGAAGCEIEEVTIVDPVDVVVAEVHVQLGEGLFGGPRVSAFLHRTLGAAGESLPVRGATVVVQRTSDGLTLEMGETTEEVCVATTPFDGTGSCYWVASSAARLLGPGDPLTLRVDLPDGRVLESRSTVPGDFELVGLEEGAACALPPGRPLEVRWRASAGSWAYVNETLIEGLGPALAARGVTLDPEDDPLYLLGLSVSASDTTIVFPGEFGVFNRFELDQGVALALQEGLPAGTSARVTIAAADRNYVNWVRGGNFNPSGQVRVPSVRGDGTGVFGSTVIRTFRVYAEAPGQPADLPACPADG